MLDRGPHGGYRRLGRYLETHLRRSHQNIRFPFANADGILHGTSLDQNIHFLIRPTRARGALAQHDSLDALALAVAYGRSTFPGTPTTVIEHKEAQLTRFMRAATGGKASPGDDGRVRQRGRLSTKERDATTSLRRVPAICPYARRPFRVSLV